MAYCLMALLPQSVLEIPTGPPVRGRQLWRRTGNFLLIFLQFYVYDLRFKQWGPTTFLTEFQTLYPMLTKCQLDLQQHISVTLQSKYKYFWQCIWKCCLHSSQPHCVNSSPPSAAYMRRWTGSALVQVMACRLCGAKPLPEPVLTYSQFDP